MLSDVCRTRGRQAMLETARGLVIGYGYMVSEE